MADAPLEIDVVTIFPRMLDSILGESILKRAQEAGLVRIRCVNLRDFATGAHLTTDDRPYGGGPGMVMKPEPVFKAVDALRRPESKVILMTPQGAPFKQAMAMALSKEAWTPSCGFCPARWAGKGRPTTNPSPRACSNIPSTPAHRSFAAWRSRKS